MDRGKFDRWLASLIPPSVDKKYNSLFKGFTEVNGVYEIKYLSNGKEMTAKVKAIVGADGAFSKVRRAICDNTFPDEYISIQEWYECKTSIPYFTAIFDEEITDFYSWIIPKENYLLFGSALRPKDNVKEKYSKLKAKLKGLGIELNKKIKSESAFIYRPRKTSQFYIGKDNIALIGESAGAISPSSAEGISYALKTSLYLAQSLEDGLDGFLERYDAKVNDIRLNLIWKNLKCPAMYNPFIRKLAIKSGIQSIK